MPALRVVVAPDSFKGTLSADEAGEAIAAGWVAGRPGDDVTVCPMADGGEGTLEIIHRATPGSTIVSVGMVTGPDGSPIPGHYAALPDGSAVVELAVSSGITFMDPLDPWGAHTLGLGQTIAQALDDGMTHIVVALGGSASNDAGLGALSALGLQTTTDDGAPLGSGAERLGRVVSFDPDSLRQAPGTMTVLRDTTATFLDAPALFGPQKGATPEDVTRLETYFRHLVERAGDTTHHLVPGSGAAGGTGWGLSVFAGAKIVDGALSVAELVGLTTLCDQADVVITGEGRFDQTSLTGKVTGAVISLARARGLPVGVVAGVVLPVDSGVVTASLVDQAGSGSAAMDDPERWARSAATALAHQFEV